MMMRKRHLLKTFLLVIVLAAVLVVIVAAMRGGLGGGTTDAARRQTFFEQFVIAGGPIVWFVLLPMSLITVYLAAEHCLVIRRKKLIPQAIGRRIVEMAQPNPRPADLRQLAAGIGDGNDLVSVAVARAVSQGGADRQRMQKLAAESLQEQALQFLRRIEWVNLIGNVSPMVGLFGTVFGMIKLFNAIVAAGGQPQPAQLAGGISVALVTTFWGLLIAIPALGLYGVFRNRIETLISAAAMEVDNTLAQIMPSLPEQSRAGQPKQKQPPIKPGIREFASKSTGPTGRPMPLR